MWHGAMRRVRNRALDPLADSGLGDDRPVTDHGLAGIETDAAPVIAQLLGSAIARSERIDGGLTTAVRRVELADGRVIGVKQYRRGRPYAVEGAALREVAEHIPVPEIVCTLDRVIAYRWIEGTTFEDCRRRDPSAAVALAAPLGRLLGALAGLRREPRSTALAPAPAQLEHGLSRARLGDALADAFRDALAAQPRDDSTCFVHGDFVGSNVIVAPTGDRIAGVIDWEVATAGSILCDVGSLFRHADRFSGEFQAAFAEAHGGLPAHWLGRARLLDAARLLAMLADDREPPDVHTEVRDLVAGAVACAQRR
jgi:aminoglycoside phosphotransferase